MITSKPVLARASIVGQYNFQYPDLEGAGILVPKESRLEELHWVSPESYQAFVWHDPEGSRVVWVRDEQT